MYPETQTHVAVFINETEITVPSTDTVAMAVLRAGLISTRTNPATGQLRAPYCMMGVCFECLLDINGKELQSCLITVTEGMKIHTKIYGGAINDV